MLSPPLPFLGSGPFRGFGGMGDFVDQAGNNVTTYDAINFLQTTAQLSPADALAVSQAPYDNLSEIYNLIKYQGVPTYQAITESRIDPLAGNSTANYTFLTGLGLPPNVAIEIMEMQGLNQTELQADVLNGQSLAQALANQNFNTSQFPGYTTSYSTGYVTPATPAAPVITPPTAAIGPTTTATPTPTTTVSTPILTPPVASVGPVNADPVALPTTTVVAPTGSTITVAAPTSSTTTATITPPVPTPTTPGATSPAPTSSTVTPAASSPTPSTPVVADPFDPTGMYNWLTGMEGLTGASANAVINSTLNKTQLYNLVGGSDVSLAEGITAQGLDPTTLLAFNISPAAGSSTALSTTSTSTAADGSSTTTTSLDLPSTIFGIPSLYVVAGGGLVALMLLRRS